MARWARYHRDENKRSTLAAIVHIDSEAGFLGYRKDVFLLHELQGTRMKSLILRLWRVKRGKGEAPRPAPALKAVPQEVITCQVRAGEMVPPQQGSSAPSVRVCGTVSGWSCRTASGYRAWAEEEPNKPVSGIKKTTIIQCQWLLSDAFWMVEILRCWEKTQNSPKPHLVVLQWSGLGAAGTGWAKGKIPFKAKQLGEALLHPVLPEKEKFWVNRTGPWSKI